MHPLSPLDLSPAPYNPRTLSPEAAAGLTRSLQEFGDIAGITWNARTKRLVTGHQRLAQLRQLHGDRLRIEIRPGEEDERAKLVAPDGQAWAIRIVDWPEEREKAANIAANNPLIGGEFDLALLEPLLEETRAWNLELIGELRLDDLWARLNEGAEEGTGAGIPQPKRGSLRERFIVPPFSVLDSRRGYWRERKRAWLALGIDSGSGRSEDLLFASSAQPPAVYQLRLDMAAERGGQLPSWEDVAAEATKRGIGYTTRTSIFDPVLAEIALAWFSPKGGRVLDPFAGGSVRGVVSAALGRPYFGVDLRLEQTEANRLQWAAIGASDVLQSAPPPRWLAGDSREIRRILGPHADGPFDFLLTCPPYADLEVYSDDPADLSNAGSYEAFLVAYRAIIAASASLLQSDRFAAVVIGDVRDPKTGCWRGLVDDTVRAFADVGMPLYNHAIYLEPTGSAATRAPRNFRHGKLTKVHQSLLVLVKGDPAKAIAARGEIDAGSPEEWAGLQPETEDVAEAP